MDMIQEIIEAAAPLDQLTEVCNHFLVERYIHRQ